MKKRQYKILYGFLTLCVLAAFIRYGVGTMLGREEIYFRTWLLMALDILIWAGIPVGLVAILAYRLFRKKPEGSRSGIWRGVLVSVAVTLLGIYLIVLIFGFALIRDSIYEDERMLVGGIMSGSRNDWDIGALYRYYEDVGVFTKKRCKDEERIAAAVMADRYQEEFILTESETDGLGYYAGSGYLVSMPDMTIHISAYGAYQYYSDDRREAQTWYRIQEFLQENEISTDIEEPGHLYCTYGTLKDCAEDAAAIIGYLLRDPFLAENGGSIKVTCGAEAKGKNTKELSFGNTDPHSYQSGVYFEDPDHVYEALVEEFKDNPYAMNESPFWEEESETAEEEGTDTETPEEEAERLAREEEERLAKARENLLLPEGSGWKLYQTVFEPQGYSWQENYNAKGNYYAVLENGEEMEHTIVYDRESKNGKCQLFVEYQNYLQTNGSERSVVNTKIVEFYAVDMITGEVCVAGKTSWEQVGNAKYREMTGE